MPSARFFNWCFTSFACDADHYEKLIDEKLVTYIAWGEETCPTTDRKHHQGFLHTKKKISSTEARRLIPGAHIEIIRGSLADNERYCSKEGQLNELGTKPKQGQRTDLNEICEQVLAGTRVDDILAVNPEAYHQYGRTLLACEDIQLRKQRREHVTQGLWLWGPTGTGKSERAFGEFSPETHYTLNLEDKGWWDGYTGQEIVILDDFRGQLPYSFLLKLADRYPVTVPRRCRAPAPFMAKLIIITSPMSPNDVYHNLAEKDSLAQLFRRFEVEYCAPRAATHTLYPTQWE